jgi:hypothetical protein
VTSTSALTCTEYVPESITGSVSAGQRLGTRYKSRLDMKRTTGNADQRIRPARTADQRSDVLGGPTRYFAVRSRVVPVFYRRIRRKTVDTLAVAGLFLAILPITVLLDWEERQQRGAR